MSIPDYLTRYYQKDEYPFLSLNDLPLEEANKVKTAHCIKNGIGEFYAQNDYLIHRKEIEKYIYKELVRIGGTPLNNVPIYMVLGKSPIEKYNIKLDIQKNAEEITIPIEEIDLLAVTFTYPDSMYEFVLDEDGSIVEGRRTNTPKIYLYHELSSVINKYIIFENYQHYIEAQVWNRDMLMHYSAKQRGITHKRPQSQ